MGYDVTATGTVTSIDVVYRTLKINTGRTNEKGPVDEVIKFDDLLDVSGDGIVGIDEFLGIEPDANCEDFPADE